MRTGSAMPRSVARREKGGKRKEPRRAGSGTRLPSRPPPVAPSEPRRTGSGTRLPPPRPRVPGWSSSLLPSLPPDLPPNPNQIRANVTRITFPQIGVEKRLRLRNNIVVFPYCTVDGSTSGGVGQVSLAPGQWGLRRTVCICLSQGSCPWAVPTAVAHTPPESAAAQRIDFTRNLTNVPGLRVCPGQHQG